MGEIGGYVGVADGVEGAGGMPLLEEDFGEGGGCGAVAGVVFAEGFADGEGAGGLAVAEEEPGGGQKELALIGGHGCLGGASWKTVTMILS